MIVYYTIIVKQQGVVAHMLPVEAFATRIKSFDQQILFLILDQVATALLVVGLT